MLYLQEKDEALVNMTLLGDQEAYGALVLRWQKAVLSAAHAVTRSDPLAEDASQDAFVSAWLALSKLNDPSKYGAWVVRIAKNRAKNLVLRYKEWLDIDTVVSAEYESDIFYEGMAEPSDENELLHENVSALSEKIRKVITLHYFEGYSIAEISDMLAIPTGTVKARLYEGRKKLRKEYGLMDEKENATLVEKVLAKVEELKLWGLKDSKAGFDKVYNECLEAVESLPESKEKYHALADTLVRGYWWVKGKANDEVMARIREAAELSHNEEAMQSVVCHEYDALDGEERIKLIRDILIPRMQKMEFPKTEAYLHFWLGCMLLDDGRRDEGLAEYQKALRLLTPADIYYPCSLAALKAETLGSREKGFIKAISEEYKFIDGIPRFSIQPGYSRTQRRSADAPCVGYYTSRCDGMFFTKNAVQGEKIYSSSRNATLTLIEKNVTVTTPCGVFEGCEVWQTSDRTTTAETYYKDGIGIVRQNVSSARLNYTCVLCAYNIEGGSGLFPLAKGNSWDYAYENYPNDVMKLINHREVVYADGKKANLMEYAVAERLKYSDTDWLDTLTELCDEYFVLDDPENWNGHCADMSGVIDRLEKLASTPYQKATTRLASQAIRRLMACEEKLQDKPKMKNHWSFFEVSIPQKRRYDIGRTRSLMTFELTDMAHNDWTPGTWETRHPLLWNDIYGILDYTTECLWSDEWVVGAKLKKEFQAFGNTIGSHIEVSEAGKITTPAGAFDDCICVHITCGDFPYGWSFIQNPKEYYFAPRASVSLKRYIITGTMSHSRVYMSSPPTKGAAKATSPWSEVWSVYTNTDPRTALSAAANTYTKKTKTASSILFATVRE